MIAVSSAPLGDTLWHSLDEDHSRWSAGQGMCRRSSTYMSCKGSVAFGSCKRFVPWLLKIVPVTLQLGAIVALTGCLMTRTVQQIAYSVYLAQGAAGEVAEMLLCSTIACADATSNYGFVADC